MIRLAIRVRREQAELVLAELLELTPTGVEELEPSPGTVEYAVYGAPGELPALPDLKAAAGEALVEVSTTEVPDDWHERWRDFHRPVTIPAPDGGDLPGVRVRPPWEAPAGEGGLLEIAIDPGQAFGTGGHASTRLCIELLLEMAAEGQPRAPVLDVGTGSGVLAIAAGLLGYGPLLGLDNEAESVRAAAENAARNGVQLEVRRFDLRSEELPWPAPGPRTPVIVLANLLRPLLLEMAESLPGPPAHLIAGGLLEPEVEEVAAAFAARLGLRERSRRLSGGWAAVWLAAG